jgi:hypothetical protein
VDDKLGSRHIHKIIYLIMHIYYNMTTIILKCANPHCENSEVVNTISGIDTDMVVIVAAPSSMDFLPMLILVVQW